MRAACCVLPSVQLQTLSVTLVSVRVNLMTPAFLSKPP